MQTVAEAEPLGTGGGMKNAGAGISDPFILLNSDVISQIDLTALLAAHRRRSAFGTMYLAEVEDTRPYGVAALGEDDRIERFIEKPEPAESPSHWINAGIAVWDRAVLDAIPSGRPVSFEREIVPGVLERGVFGYLDRGFWEDAGSPERLLRAQRLLFDAGRAAPSEPPRGRSRQPRGLRSEDPCGRRDDRTVRDARGRRDGGIRRSRRRLGRHGGHDHRGWGFRPFLDPRAGHADRTGPRGPQRGAGEAVWTVTGSPGRPVSRRLGP